MDGPEYTEKELAIAQRLKDDFPHYAEKCLNIRPKRGSLIPFRLNSVQNIIHQKLEAQLAKTGRVRALILKARQPGCSTYVQGRFYHKVTHRRGVRAFILTHMQEATDNIFGMADRFQQECPKEVRPSTGRANAKELLFDRLDSGYRVGTAGTKGVGRSDTIQYFHGSEVAHWTNAEDHMTGALQAVPDEDETEVILESTANGVGGLFYTMCKAAERGDSEYQLIFISWFYHDEYEKEPPEGWQPPSAFRTYQEMHDLTEAQTYWAYIKNRDLALSLSADDAEICWKFRQEYPASAEEAFQTGGDESFIKSEAVARARKNTVEVNRGTPIVLGVDIARGGKDKTRIIDRQGRKLGGHSNMTIDSDDLMVIAGTVAKEIERIKPAAVFLDVTGLGAGVYDRLNELNYGRIIHAINFSQKPIDERVYANKRAEMWGELRDWLDDPAGVDIPDDDSIHSQFCAPIWGKGATKYNSNGQILLEPKAAIKARLSFSPDAGDAAGLTFAEPVQFQEDWWDGEYDDVLDETGRSVVGGY